MAKFEDAVIASLATLPLECWQRVDGLMCESAVLKLYPHWFPHLRLWLLEKRGLIESWPSSGPLLSFRGLRSYRLRRGGYARRES